MPSPLLPGREDRGGKRRRDEDEGGGPWGMLRRWALGKWGEVGSGGMWSLLWS